MFGHQDDRKDNDTQDASHLIPEPSIDGILSSEPEHQGGTTVVPSSDASQDDSFNPALPPSDNQPGAAPAQSDDDHFADDLPVVTDGAVHDNDSSVAASDTGALAASDTNGLLDIKQQALTQLTPLVDQLDQSPEEKFRTTMMMIQASDNQSLVPVAYEAAQAIPDEKAKAQALLDIVNEINYFTQHPAN